MRNPNPSIDTNGPSNNHALAGNAQNRKTRTYYVLSSSIGAAHNLHFFSHNQFSKLKNSRTKWYYSYRSKKFEIKLFHSNLSNLHRWQLRIMPFSWFGGHNKSSTAATADARANKSSHLSLSSSAKQRARLDEVRAKVCERFSLELTINRFLQLELFLCPEVVMSCWKLQCFVSLYANFLFHNVQVFMINQILSHRCNYCLEL